MGRIDKMTGEQRASRKAKLGAKIKAATIHSFDMKREREAIRAEKRLARKKPTVIDDRLKA